MKTHKNMLWMVIGCVLPLLLVFLAPALGIFNNITLFIFIAAMFAFHLLIPMHNHENLPLNNDEEPKNSENTTFKNNNHEQNQH